MRKLLPDFAQHLKNHHPTLAPLSEGQTGFLLRFEISSTGRGFRPMGDYRLRTVLSRKGTENSHLHRRKLELLPHTGQHKATNSVKPHVFIGAESN